MRVIDDIVKENDIKKVAPEDYGELAKEIRRILVRTISRTGGHLASNLGSVELTMALHLFLDLPADKLIWDVGHQAYVHKILTGRIDSFNSLRSLGGISGFPKRKENECDVFDTGHSSNSISVALGMAKARDLQGTAEKIFAVIGDGSMTGGMSFEALNNAAALKSNIVIVLNDNAMSISKNVGGMSKYLGRIRSNIKYRTLKDNIENALDKIPNVGKSFAKTIKNAKDSVKHLFVPGMFFEEIGVIYIGPVDGHNISEMLEAFEAAAQVKDQPVIVHVLTKKGKGYRPAFENPSDFHGVGKFDIQTGIIKDSDEITYTEVFGDWMVRNANEYEDIVSVCAAMPDGTGLNEFANQYPDRFFDVGIAEEHAITFAAGLAISGMRPVVSIYSTFLQRAYDQIMQDVCLNNSPVILAIDRSGIVGKDGETHQGIYDISYLSTMPNMTIISPMDSVDMIQAFNYAYENMKTPVAIRYPRGAAAMLDYEDRQEYEYGKAQVLERGRDVLLLAVGNMVNTALDVAKILKESKISAEVVNMRFVKPFDEDLVERLAKKFRLVVTLEDNVYSGGFSQNVEAFLQRKRVSKARTLAICWDDIFVEHGSPEQLYELYGLDAKSVAAKIMGAIRR